MGIVDLSYERERRRLDSGAGDERPSGVGAVEFSVSCTGDAKDVLDRAVEVLRIVDAHAGGGWPDDGRWRELLPSWFVDACAPEMTQEQADAWLAVWEKLSEEEREQEERDQRWSLADWLHWMQPSERQWFWWDARIHAVDTATVALEVAAWPFPWGAFKWLMSASGARDVESAE